MPFDNSFEGEGMMVQVQPPQPPEITILNLPPVRRSLVARLWATYYPPAPGAFAFAFGEEIMPPSTVTFVIAALLAFAQIKSQGQDSNAIIISVSSLLLYGLLSAAQLFVPADSVYAVITRLARIVFLWIVVVGLASLFYL